MPHYTLVELESLPPSMIVRAKWAREQILDYPEKSEIDFDELLAWVYHEEDKCWYSIAGNYSYSSPKEKMKKRKEQINKQEKNVKKYEKLTNERFTQQEYWSKVRQKILKRDKNTCQRCGDKYKKLDIHHIVKQRLNGVDSDDNLISLCRKCHRKTDVEYGK